jgi:hypothetical protein
MADNELRISDVPDGLVITDGRLDKGRLDKEVKKKQLISSLRTPQVCGG